MKIRTGFVSNSSSSSFILGVKPGIKEIEPLVADSIGIEEGSIFFSQKKEIVKSLTESLEVVDIDDEIEEQDGHESGIKYWTKLKETGWQIFRGSLCSDAEPAESALCYSTFEIKKEDLFIIKDYAGF